MMYASESDPGKRVSASSAATRDQGVDASDAVCRAEELAAANEALHAEIRDRKRAEGIARGQAEALARTLNLLAADPEIDKFAGQVLHALTQQLGAHSGEFWLYDAAQRTPILYLAYDDSSGLQIYSRTPGSRAARALVGLQPPEKRHSVLRSNTPQVFCDIAEAPIDERYLATLIDRGIQTLVVVPLVSGEEFVGSFTLLDTAHREYRSEELELAQALAQQAVLSIQLTRLAEKSRQAAVLEERNRIAREMHDTLAQSFAGILLQLRVARRIADQEPEEAWRVIERASDLAQHGLADARRSVGTLQPETAEDRDLVGALATAVNRMASDAPAELEFDVQGDPPDALPPTVGQHLHRIAQEAITNALRHSDAQAIRIGLAFEPGCVRLLVHDNGRGFDPGAQAGEGGFGLTSMSQRAERLGGRLQIASELGHGTDVRVWIPLYSGDAGQESL